MRAITDKLVTVEMNQSYDVINKEWKNEVYVKLYRTALSTGLVAELGAKRWTTLCVIALYMQEDGTCYPTQKQIAEGLGVSLRTANEYINDLLDFRWHGKPIVQRAMVKGVSNGSGYLHSVYTILPLSQFAIFNGKIEVPDSVKPKKSMCNSLHTNKTFSLPNNKQEKDLY